MGQQLVKDLESREDFFKVENYKNTFCKLKVYPGGRGEMMLQERGRKRRRRNKKGKETIVMVKILKRQENMGFRGQGEELTQGKR